jgi:outer membrane protein TolC
MIAGRRGAAMRLAALGHLVSGDSTLTRRSRLPRSFPALLRIAAFGALAAAFAPPAPALELSLPEARARLRSSHEALKAAGHEVRERQAEVGSADALMWPKLEANARWTRLDGPITIDLDPVRQVILALHPNVPGAAVPPFILDVQDEQYGRADVRLTWPLFTGGKIDAARDAAGARLADANATMRGVEEGLSAELARRYFAVRLAARAVAVREEVLAGLDGHVKNARRLEEEGFLSRAESLHAEVARTEADRELKASRHDLALAQEALAGLLSLPGEEAGAVVPTTPLFVLESLPPLDGLKKSALDANPALARLSASAGLAGAGLAGEKARWYPELGVFGYRELYKAGLTLLDPVWAAGVSARWTLFDGFSREKGIVAAKERVARVDELTKRARRDVETLVEKKYREATKAREQVEAFGAALALARENLRVRTRAFEEGVATSLDVVDARSTLARVELGRLAAARDFDVALAELLEVAGQSDRYEALVAGAPGDVEK